MSRKRKNKFHGGSNKKGNQPPAHATRHVPLAEWNRFERFKSFFAQLETAVTDLQEQWNHHVNFLCGELRDITDEFEGLHATVVRVSETIKSIGQPAKKSKRRTFVDQKKEEKEKPYANYRPKKKKKSQAQFAEVIIEDISDGNL